MTLPSPRVLPAGRLPSRAPHVPVAIVGAGACGLVAAIALREAGFDARYMTVGHSGWKAVGGPTKMHA